MGASEFPEQLANTMNLGSDVTSKDTNTARKMQVLEVVRILESRLAMPALEVCLTKSQFRNRRRGEPKTSALPIDSARLHHSGRNPCVVWEPRERRNRNDMANDQPRERRGRREL